MKNLAVFRKGKRWSQQKLSDQSGVSQTYISELEADKKQPTVLVAQKIAAALGITLSKLLNEKSQSPKFKVG